MQKNFLKLAKISLVLVYLVIVAGAVVRMTGSGMGCPDWPKCFGYYIPPTDITTLQWEPEREFKKGHVIIENNALKVAIEDFVTSKEFNESHWEAYTKHDYAEFNVWHTWIEYVNRLVTVLLGIPMIALLIISFFLFKKDKKLTLFTALTFVLLGIQAVLGKIVVDTNLKAGMITVHMVFAFLLVAMLLYLIYRATPRNKTEALQFDSQTIGLIKITAFITLLQVILGTQVREFIDYQIDLLGYTTQDLWLSEPPFTFYLHRSFSIVIVLLNLYLLRRILKGNPNYPKAKWAIALILLSVITGMVMYYLNFPFTSQPIHLVLAALLFGVQFYMTLETRKGNKSL